MLSIIIPAYNAEKFLRQTIESCYDQGLDGYCDWEIVLCDDASSDGTWDIISYYLAHDRRVRAVRHRSNEGQNPSKIDCINASHGELVFALDHDNVLSTGLMPKLIDVLKSNYTISAVSVQELRFFGLKDSLESHDSWVFEFPSNICTLAECVTSFKTPASGGNYLFTRRMYDLCGGYLGHDADLHGDWGFALNHMAKGHSIYIVPGTYYYHRYNPDGMYISIARDPAKMRRLKHQYRDLLMRHIERFDRESQLAIRRASDGHELISSGKLRVA